MAKHPGLNDMSRRGRMATYSSEDDLQYFATHVVPLLREYYAELREQNKVPFNSTLDGAMSWVRDTTRRNGNIIRSDERAFIYPTLNEAHRLGGTDELRATFDDLVEIYTTSHTRFIERMQPKIDALVAVQDKIEELVEEGKRTPSPLKAFANMIEKKITGKLSAEFNRAKKIGALTSEAKTAYDDIIRVEINSWGYAAFHPHQYGYTNTASAEDIAELAKRHKQGTLITTPLEQSDLVPRKSADRFPEYLVKRKP